MIQVARVFWPIVLIACICAPFAAAEVPIADFARHPLHMLIARYAWNGPGHSANSLGAQPEVYCIDVRDGKKNIVTTSPMRGANFLADHKGAIRFSFGVSADQTHKVWYPDAQGGDCARKVSTAAAQ